MSIYKEIEIELSKVYKVGQSLTKCNNLIKLKYKTEDTQIREYIDRIVPILEGVHNYYSLKLYTKSSNKLKEIKSIELELLDYCNNITAQGKPEWMVLAERNGWAPKKS